MQYEMLESFLIAALKDAPSKWSYEEDAHHEPSTLEFAMDFNKMQSSHINFSSSVFNELDIYISGTSRKRQTITVNINKVPVLMNYLTRGQLNFQIGSMTTLGQEFSKVDNYVDEILHKGKFHDKLVFVERIADVPFIKVRLNEERILSIVPQKMNRFHLNLQPISVYANFKDIRDYDISYKKLFTLEQIKELTFIRSLIHIPKIENPEINPNIEKFIEDIANMGCEILSPIAKKLALSHHLNASLGSKEVQKKTLKL